MEIGWTPYAAKTLLGLAASDQRRLVDAVGEFRARVGQEMVDHSGEAPRCMSVNSYDIYFSATHHGVEVQDVRLSRGR